MGLRAFCTSFMAFKAVQRLVLNGSCEFLDLIGSCGKSSLFMLFHLSLLVWSSAAQSRYYFVRHVSSGYCLDVWGQPGLALETPLSLWECEFGVPNSDHAWTFELGLFRNTLSGLCLDVAGSTGENEATVQINACETYEALNAAVSDQIWTQEAANSSNGSYFVNRMRPSRCLSVWAEDYSPGAWITLQDCEYHRSNRTSQVWEMVEVCLVANSNAFNRSCLPAARASGSSRSAACHALLASRSSVPSAPKAFKSPRTSRPVRRRRS